MRYSEQICKSVQKVQKCKNVFKILKRVPKCESKTMVIKSLQKCDKHEKGEEGDVDSELKDFCHDEVQKKAKDCSCLSLFVKGFGTKKLEENVRE